MAHAVAYSRLLISVMLRSGPCLMLVGARFARFRVSAIWLLIFTVETGLLFFMAISFVISHFCLMRFSTSAIFASFGVCWGAPFSCSFLVFRYNFQDWWRLCWFLWGIWLGLDVVCPSNPVLDFLELCWRELLLSFYVPMLVGQVVSVDIGFGIWLLIAPNFVSLGGVIFTW